MEQGEENSIQPIQNFGQAKEQRLGVAMKTLSNYLHGQSIHSSPNGIQIQDYESVVDQPLTPAPFTPVHYQMYMQAKKHIDQMVDLGTDFKEAVKYLKHNKIKCKKYNNSLDQDTQKFFHFHASLELVDDREFRITILKPIEQFMDPNHSKGDDEDKEEGSSSQPKDSLFKEAVSTSSCLISDIKSIVYGGISSRFWVLRKHFNSMSQVELLQASFYSWQCVTLCLEHRDVDLVIPNERDMKTFLIFLIHQLRTINGLKGSAKKMLTALNN